jgi:hypothetical protein
VIEKVRERERERVQEREGEGRREREEGRQPSIILHPLRFLFHENRWGQVAMAEFWRIFVRKRKKSG